MKLLWSYLRREPESEAASPNLQAPADARGAA